MTEHQQLLMTSWQGHAARAADAYFTKFADAVGAQHEVLPQGKESLREAASTDVFDQGVAVKVSKGLDRLRTMSPEELCALAEQGERALTPPPPKPVAKRPTAPPRADDDDDYEGEVMESWCPESEVRRQLSLSALGSRVGRELSALFGSGPPGPGDLELVVEKC